jgi:predicted metal-binding membrane protein
LDFGESVDCISDFPDRYDECHNGPVQHRLYLAFHSSMGCRDGGNMFPVMSSVILLYNILVKEKGGSSTVLVEGRPRYSANIVVFAVCYLAVWALKDIVLVLGWSFLINSTVVAAMLSSAFYGWIMVAGGAKQFSPLKSKCLRYCESSMSFFMRRKYQPRTRNTD